MCHRLPAFLLSLRLIVNADFSDNDEAEFFSLVLSISISVIIVRYALGQTVNRDNSVYHGQSTVGHSFLWVAKDVGEDILEPGHATVSSKANVTSNEQWCIVL